MKKIFLVYGHYNKHSFNASIKDTFIEEPDEKVLDHRKRIEDSDVIV